MRMVEGLIGILLLLLGWMGGGGEGKEEAPLPLPLSVSTSISANWSISHFILLESRSVSSPSFLFPSSPFSSLQLPPPHPMTVNSLLRKTLPSSGD